MDRRAGLGLAAHAALVASLATPVYDPLFAGDDEWWALPALLVFAHLALGAAVGRWWALLLPLALAVAFFLLGGAEEIAWLWLIAGAPVLIAVTAIGLARDLDPRARAGAARRPRDRRPQLRARSPAAHSR